MTQPLIPSFFQKKNSLKRNYGDVVTELVRRAEETFETKNLKVKVIKKSISNSHQEEEKKSLPLPKMSYKKYTESQKEAILNLVPYMSNVQIEQKFGVDEATARYWVKHGIKEDQRKNNGKVADFDEIEKDLA